MQLDPIKALVTEDFQAVNALMVHSLRSEASIIDDLGHYLIQSGGKRLRPLILLLIARACGTQGTQPISLATVIELIHTATLLHDDVVDDSPLRRGQKTANSVWGNEAAVLVGDFLYSKAFQILMNVENLRAMKILADATNQMAEGEALQLLERHNPETTEGAYLKVIRCKTAKLFEASAQIAAVLANTSPELEQNLAQYGMHLGTAFQLIDDVLDYEGRPSQTGKSVGNDLAEGKMTLPLIQVLENANAREGRIVREAIRSGDPAQLATIQAMIHRSGALEYTRHYAKIEAERAQKALSFLDPSPYRDAAHALADFAICRDN